MVYIKAENNEFNNNLNYWLNYYMSYWIAKGHVMRFENYFLHKGECFLQILILLRKGLYDVNKSIFTI